uniref:Putative head-elevated expression protein n=1 Tax=Tabanus bromius TaxID=304241 RepID=A0A0K8TKV7_TABBR
MGASQSGQKRTVTLQNPYPEGVISVSEDVVHRLRGNARERAAERQEQQKHAQAAAPAPPPPTAALEKSTAPSSIPSSHGNTPVYPPPNVIFVEPTITAMDVRRQKEAELTQNDVYWKKRLNQLEQTLNKTNAIMEKEYSAAMEDVRKSFQNAPATHQLPPCQDLKAQLIACYRAHPGEILRCSEEVAAFTNCVSENRVKKLDQSNADGGNKTKPADVKK